MHQISSILEDLYYGKIRPNELTPPDHPEDTSLHQHISTITAYFKQKLSNDEFKLLEDLLDFLDQSTSIQSKDSFINGFKIATLIMTEVYTDNPQPINRNPKSI